MSFLRALSKDDLDVEGAAAGMVTAVAEVAVVSVEGRERCWADESRPDDGRS